MGYWQKISDNKWRYWKDEKTCEEATGAPSKGNFIFDEMEPTKHPLNGRYYTSKKAFRAVTKARGYEEVGTAYEHGYDPEKERAGSTKELAHKLINEIRERRYGS